MCNASKPKVEHTAPPPMTIPTVENENVQRARRRERLRAANAFGRESTILGVSGGLQAGPVAPTTQAKTLLGS